MESNSLIKELEIIKDVVQDTNINFLVGSGMSTPYLPTLGNIEKLLTGLEENKSLDNGTKKLLRASLYKQYFDKILYLNKGLLKDKKTGGVLESYNDFLKIINTILLRRKSTILSKQINLFTTNVDVFFERAFEETGVESNDGFSGRFNPIFDPGNFKKALFKKSLHYDNTSEIPVFNLLKLHGSLTWRLNSEDKIRFSSTLHLLEEIKKEDIPNGSFVEIQDTDSIETLIEKAEQLSPDLSQIEKYSVLYEKLSIINPDKDKFKHTLLNQTYYDLLRIYSNELEKENTVLFVMGFSFADDHIRKMTLRVANSNPTLIIYIFAYTSIAVKEIKSKFDIDTIKNNNIKFISPVIIKEEDNKEKDEFSYDFKTINEKIFDELLRKIGEKDTLNNKQGHE